MGAPIARSEQSDGGPGPVNPRSARRTVKSILVMTAVVLITGSTGSHAQTGPGPQELSSPVAGAAPASDDLSDLGAMTFGCPKAALNAAAREAAKVPSQGTYQFSYFKIVNDAHHAAYEVHFKSNYEGEADLKYCVALYCQQGWDPKTTKTSVRPIGSERQSMATAHGADCSGKPAPAKRGVKR
jgi:hypothetical protein